MSTTRRRQVDLDEAKARLLDELLDTLESITTDETRHPDVLESLEVTLKYAKLQRKVAENAVAARVCPEAQS